MYRVAITGVGLVSTLGRSWSDVSHALRTGISGVHVDEERRQRGFRSPLTGIIPSDISQGFLNRKQKKTMPDFAEWAYVAVYDALTQSGLSMADIANEQTGLIFGCDSSCIAAVEQVERLNDARDTQSIGSGYVFRSMTSTITMNLNTLLGTKGACWTLSSACSSGGHAVGQAADLIRLGRQDRVICGGAQEVNWQSMCSFDGLGAFSTRVTEPDKASRPFDADRDGLVPSGGAAALILERYESALARGAVILGEVIGYGFSSDGLHISVPSGDGLKRAMHAALADGNMSAQEVDYVCAHATSTPAGDEAEANTIHEVFGEHKPYISSTKSLTGHELWMSGASQVVYSTIMANDQFLAANANFQTPDHASKGLNILTESIACAPKIILCNSAGFGGTNSCLLLRYHHAL
ncbi:beta-ketoacyl-[acyl-carrier-protein] synthase family protein [Chrysiogenes arsenatis]|uniref:beta-ketoacyl-[acyl-carrier-protein] synthase family protein n=1 Tax=Chrysiogenes arsenatis TaxID=309797 RepID=UPI000488704D|nr:beta-ketoacyl-[acyl-carrier-protein] synthase family protein [Chrysiogenes arsenatis]